jgi:SAM-dependent methyltransferase
MKKITVFPTLLNPSMGEYAKIDWHDYYNSFIHLIPQGASVLDVGSGRGGLALWLNQNRECDVACIDASPEAVRACEVKGLRVYQLDLNSELTDIPGQYDMVLFSSSLESLLDPFGVVKQIQKNIKKGGGLLIWLPNFSFFESRIAYLRGKPVKCIGYSERARQLGVWGYDDIQFFTKASLELMLREAGFTKLEWHLGTVSPKFNNFRDCLKSVLICVLKLLFVRNHPDLFSSYLCVVAKH